MRIETQSSIIRPTHNSREIFCYKLDNAKDELESGAMFSCAFNEIGSPWSYWFDVPTFNARTFYKSSVRKSGKRFVLGQVFIVGGSTI